MSKTLTVVYEINDDGIFQSHMDIIQEKFLLDKGVPWRVYCMSVDDEPHRVQLMHEAAQHDDYRGNDLADLIEEIWQCQDLTQYDGIEDFLKRDEPKDD